MRALIVDRSAPGQLRIADVPDPVPAPHQALVRITAISPNPAEFRYILPGVPDGAVIGWDAAGVVERAAADGSGPAAGTPVTTLGLSEGWAELRAVDTALIGTVPEGADPGEMSTLPVSAGTALRALRKLGPLLGRRVLITGASGAVGRFAVQLAARGGAYVVAVARKPELAAELRALGADEVVTGPGGVTGPVDGVLDQVGGPDLAAYFGLLGEGGTLVLTGAASGGSTVFEPGALLADPARRDRAIVTFFEMSGDGIDRDLSWLAAEVAGGRLRPHIAVRGDWADATATLDAVRESRLAGKAVLDLG
ncbi:zinc-binding dehydrogenase [Streptomyces qinzhouensis]|uniref:Zinc-binding dehydrogenase n=1 Tax=Streptomyces qinzhouensis TaxID=2599401 RepID=A0A5B8JCR1_9ACTN|nr:zinc-binding dehydrogenase [Streptomyces qinzhouensis]QDY78214.1 zinc-binding dehydrogenase [Streptomyces qinzhouensis]